MDTIQPIELIWFVLNLCGLLFALFNVTDSHEDYVAAEQLTDGTKAAAKSLARLSIQQEIVRAVPLFLFCVIGVVAMSEAPDPHPQTRPVPIMLISGGFVLVSIALVLNSVLQFHGRRKIIKDLERGKEMM